MVKQYDVDGKILEGGGGDGDCSCFEDRSSGRCGNSGASSSSFHSSTEGGGGRGGVGDVYRPDFEEKKAKLLYMQEEVSNGFINARVRLWKSMVEEILMLETKGMSGMDLNCMNKSTEKAMADQRSKPQLNKPAVSRQMTNENSCITAND